MSRMARVVLPHYPHHVVQRGHNRQVIFAERRDYQRYLDTLREYKEQYRVAVHAFCLMTNHVHLLLSPSDPTGLGELMKRLAGRQTRHHNRLENRTGTLWEGRYRSSPVERDDYLLACSRYIELNPVRARMVAEPQSYAWSSCRYRLGLDTAAWLDYDPFYLALGPSDAERRRRYREFLLAAVPSGEWDLIRAAVQRGQLTGADRFTEEVAGILGRRLERRGQGRPAKSEGVT
ncbi:MAG: transposase [Acidobacteriota bacterium]|nr:transposase [Acidobacteriota bacterium]